MTDQLAAKATALGGVDGFDLVEVDAAAEPELFLELDLDGAGHRRPARHRRAVGCTVVRTEDR
jgi:hypothetical protein